MTTDARGPGRPRQTSAREIRDAARALFLERGYAGTSLAQVADAVGISRTTLFAYVPAKRDLMWEEADVNLERLRAALAEADGPDPDGPGSSAGRVGDPLVDVLVRALVAGAHFSVEEHGALSERWRIVTADDELRAHAALRTEEITAILIEAALRRAPEADAELVDHVARALVAVAARCTVRWATSPDVDRDLDDHTSDSLRPFADALRPLLP